jgi:hypothetical protein
MNKKLVIALVTASAFAMGLIAGLAVGLSHVPAMEPPSWLFSEFKSITKPCTSLQKVVQSRPDLWKKINAELYELKPQIKQYKSEIEAIDGEFRKDFEAILSPSQKSLLECMQNDKVLLRLPGAKDTPPATPAPAAPTQAKPERQPRLYLESSDGLVGSMVFIPFAQERFSTSLELDTTQQARLRELLERRRDRFISHCNQIAPPSLQLNRIADIIRKAEQESK